MLQFKTKHKKIYLFGTGGTGGYILDYITKLLKNTDIYLYDGDYVEDKNLSRQNFISNDLGLNKAEVLANRYKDRYNGKIIARPIYVTSSEDLLIDILSEIDKENILFISAVDNIATRRLLNQTINDLHDAGINATMIDCGNNNQGGQVVCYANYEVNNINAITKKTTKVKLPTMLELYPEIDIDDDNPGLVKSCADVSEPQAMMANVRNADIVSNLVDKIINDQSISANLYISDIINLTTFSEKRFK